MYYATAKEMERLDKLAVSNGLTIQQMMELAGWHIVSLFKKIKISRESKITVVVGKGNKGGDGLSAARHLTNHGWPVSVVLMSRAISRDAKHHLGLIRKIQLPIILYSQDTKGAQRAIKNSDVLIDALIGYHLDGKPRGLFKEVIELMNQASKKIIAYDLPTGLDATSGRCLSPCIQANITLTLALPKSAFETRNQPDVCGKIFVADIGIPKFLYDKISVGSRPPFERGDSGFVVL